MQKLAWDTAFARTTAVRVVCWRWPHAEYSSPYTRILYLVRNMMRRRCYTRKSARIAYLVCTYVPRICQVTRGQRNVNCCMDSFFPSSSCTLHTATIKVDSNATGQAVLGRVLASASTLSEVYSVESSSHIPQTSEAVAAKPPQLGGAASHCPPPIDEGVPPEAIFWAFSLHFPSRSEIFCKHIPGYCMCGSVK